VCLYKKSILEKLPLSGYMVAAITISPPSTNTTTSSGTFSNFKDIVPQVLRIV
jgi:hypothetical protein